MPVKSPRSRTVTVVAQDPSVLVRGDILTAELEIPAEDLEPGPCGHRVQVIDFDGSTGHFYPPRALHEDVDPFPNVDGNQILADPHFHCQNVYAIVMCTLARFERALGRRLAWGFGTHRLKVAPHAFADANAFYSEHDEALLFGYFKGVSGRRVFSCLSHDVVAHETSHALLDGLRTRYTDPSSVDQAAFHEGFADIVALLSILTLKPIIRYALTRGQRRAALENDRILTGALTHDALSDSVLLGLAEEMGTEMNGVEASALRRSIALKAPPAGTADKLGEPHARGELFVAAMMQSFVAVWLTRLQDVLQGRQDVHIERVVEEGSGAAERLLTMAIRAIDYAPAVDLRFGDYLTALLTADQEFMPDDSTYGYREVLKRHFATFGITPVTESGYWDSFDKPVRHDRSHFETLQRDPDEVHRFIWENRAALEVEPAFHTRVQSVRACLRIGADGFALRETVAEYVQIVNLKAGELASTLDVRKPDGLGDSELVRVCSGGVLIFDEFGSLKYHVQSRLKSPKQTDRLAYLAARGMAGPKGRPLRPFALGHRLRPLDGEPSSFGVAKGGW